MIWPRFNATSVTFYHGQAIPLSLTRRNFNISPLVFEHVGIDSLNAWECFYDEWFSIKAGDTIVHLELMASLWDTTDRDRWFQMVDFLQEIPSASLTSLSIFFPTFIEPSSWHILKIPAVTELELLLVFGEDMSEIGDVNYFFSFFDCSTMSLLSITTIKLGIFDSFHLDRFVWHRILSELRKKFLDYFSLKSEPWIKQEDIVCKPCILMCCFDQHLHWTDSLKQ